MFPNLKTLRDYVERTGEPAENYRFDVQVGTKATDRSKARVFPERHHLQELGRRLNYEEDAFASRRRGQAAPADYFEGGKVRPQRHSDPPRQIALFDDADGQADSID